MALHEIARPFQRSIFVSYAHRDLHWMERLRVHLKPLERACGAVIFWDAVINIGDDWNERINEALVDANAAVLLISADFLASTYVSDSEFPALLARTKEERQDFNVYPVFVSPCCYEEVTFEYRSSAGYEERPKGLIQRRPLSSVLAANDPTTPLLCQTTCQQEQTLANTARRIAEWFRELDREPVGPKPMLPRVTSRVDVSRMPRSSSFFKGRDEEVNKLYNHFEDENGAICMIVAQGGEGKSALVSHWLRQLERDDWRGARAFAWSFYSQGTRRASAAADDFVFEALKFFGDQPPHGGPPETKGKRLAELMRQENTILVLDGLEPLQDNHGMIEDEAVSMLVATLAETPSANSLCVITTRQEVADIELVKDNNCDAVETEDIRNEQLGVAVNRIRLRPLSLDDGARLLRMLGLQDSQNALIKFASQVHGHPLSLLLMGTYKRDAEPVSARQVDSSLHMLDLVMPAHVQLQIVAYERYFNSQPHRDVLRMLGLFDRPLRADEIAALRAKKIPGLTERVFEVKDDSEWQLILKRLRRAGLINEPTMEDPAGVDAHPLVREYFAHRLRSSEAVAWERGHRVLYEHLSKRNEHERLPEKFSDMMRFYQAMHHAILAGCLEEALEDVYWPIIQRGQQGFSHRQFGAFQSELTMLRACFTRPWTELREGLGPLWQAQLLGITGSRLRAVGKLEAAITPLKMSKESHTDGGHNLYAAIRARHLCELHVELGRLQEAKEFGHEAVKLAAALAMESKDDADQASEKRRDAKYQQIVAYCVLGAAQHQLGEMENAKTSFGRACDAVTDLPAWGSIKRPFSLWGFRYCEYLVDAARKASKKNRRQALAALRAQVKEMRHISQSTDIQTFVPEGDLGLLGPSLLELVEIQANFLESGSQNSSELLKKAKSVADKLRNGKRRDFIPLGILNYVQLVRAYVRNSPGEAQLLKDARGELKNALGIAKNGGMMLYQVDCLIELAWLSHVENRPKEAERLYLRAGKEIEVLGYGRRQQDWDDLGRGLGLA